MYVCTYIRMYIHTYIRIQAIAIQPVGPDAFMVVGANKVRPFTARDLIMVRRVALVARQALELN